MHRSQHRLRMELEITKMDKNGRIGTMFNDTATLQILTSQFWHGSGSKLAIKCYKWNSLNKPCQLLDHRPPCFHRGPADRDIHDMVSQALVAATVKPSKAISALCPKASQIYGSKDLECSHGLMLRVVFIVPPNVLF